MTLKIRNRITSILIALSLALLIAMVAIHSLCVIVSHLTPPVIERSSFYRLLHLFNLCWQPPPSSVASPVAVASIYAEVLCAVILLITVRVQFEKTQSQEVVYILCWAVSQLLEGSRLLVFAFGLWLRPTPLSNISRIIIMARLLAPLSLLFASVYNTAARRQYTEQNVLILFVLSSFVASIYPLNTALVSPLGFIDCGRKSLFTASLYTLYVLTMLAQVCATNLFQVISTKMYSSAVGVTILIIGSLLLSKSFALLPLLCGCFCLAVGWALYLSSLHEQYMWSV